MECNTCPQPTALPEIPVDNCPVNMKQIQRYAIQRTQETAPFTAITIIDLAEWQTLKTATDDTKVVFSPIIGGDPIIEAGERITSGGGDNSTFNGVEEVNGVNPSAFSTMFKSLSAEVETAIKKIGCEQSLTVYFFLEGGRIAAKKIGSDISGFDIQSFFLSDRNNAGFATKDTHNNSFALPAGWSENLIIYKPTWNPLTQL